MNLAYRAPYADSTDWQVYDDRFPWVLWAQHPQGGFELYDQQTGERSWTESWEGVVGFAADHAPQRGKTGLGSLFHRFTNALGITRCQPCAKRQIEMDQMGQFWDPFK